MRDLARESQTHRDRRDGPDGPPSLEAGLGGESAAAVAGDQAL